MKIRNILNTHSSLSTWLKHIEQLNEKNNHISVVNCKLIAKKMDLLNLCSFIFIIGGTNGKGTTCFVLENILLAAGYRVGLYTSPHLFKYCERIRINGKYLSDIEHTYVFSKIEFFRNTLFLTYFEFITLAALTLFQEYNLDIIILEVGLGGRLDATNIIDSNLSIITNIGIDHTDYLGVNRSSIGYEKAHIARENKFIIVGEKNIPNSVVEVVKIKKAILKKVNFDWCTRNKKNNWDYFSYKRDLYNLPYPKVSLENIEVALTALFHSPFNVSDSIIIDSIKTITLPGRFQIISDAPKIIFDVAHNPHAVLHLAKRLRKIPKVGKIYVIMGVLKDKDITGMIVHLKKIVDNWYCVPVFTDRGANLSQLINILPKNFNFLENITTAWYAIRSRIKKEDILLVFGSFYLISEAVKVINLNQ